MSGGRSYQDGCPVASALDLLGERWALLVIRELMFEPRRFSDLRADLPGIATNILSRRLTELTEAALVQKLPPDHGAGGGAYALTEQARDLAPVFKVLGRWGLRAPNAAGLAPMSPAAAALALTPLFRPQKARGQSLCIVLSMSGRAFTARVAERKLEVEAGAASGAQARIEGPPAAVLMRLSGDGTAAADGVTTDGDPRAIERFAACFRQIAGAE
ncbi:hypothetical protein ATO6_14210 [Oceanicola sp. 22II-s10i]|uniref:winged helix-turn-helix transcriptional regulator n=1 Tax=Oceanicola sp. 22II-s10i TaxID=1317116 RepID=UPI000B7497AA|nr:helix-turn-helix domain-containing protein [Oceanicola sp. 22II-s10i]OWU84198.1 hypothetical protein ATO6_14210 [Oceanicola sp. 22II-s10i]